MRNHTICRRLSYKRSGMPRMCDDGCIGRGYTLRQLPAPDGSKSNALSRRGNPTAARRITTLWRLAVVELWQHGEIFVLCKLCLLSLGPGDSCPTAWD